MIKLFLTLIIIFISITHLFASIEDNVFFLHNPSPLDHLDAINEIYRDYPNEYIIYNIEPNGKLKMSFKANITYAWKNNLLTEHIINYTTDKEKNGNIKYLYEYDNKNVITIKKLCSDVND